MVEITDRNFDKEVLQCKLPVLACFTVEWSPSSYATCLLAEDLVKRYKDIAKCVKINIEESPEVSTRYNVVAVPTILLFQDSQPMKRLIGFQDWPSLKHLVESVSGQKEATKLGNPRVD
jgi:thioredoxin 1